jgi:transcription elongation GreA/GreB family factor
MRREIRPDTGIGRQIEQAAVDADARALRAIQGPPPTEEEKAMIAGAPREPVRLFAKVLLTDLQNYEQERFTIVPHDEGDLVAGKITIASPIARALLQEYPGAVVAARTPGGKRLYRILRVDP